MRGCVNTSFRFLWLIIMVGCNGMGEESRGVALVETPTKTSSWIRIDDFESSDSIESWTLVDTRNDTDPRVENPQITEVRAENDNNYLLKKPAAEGIIGNRKALSYMKLPVPVKVGETYTFYVRFNVEYFPNNHVFGMSNLEPDGINQYDYDAFESTLRITDKHESDGTKNDGTLMVRKDGGYAKIRNELAGKVSGPLQTDTWYEAWLVADNRKANEGGQKYDVYLRGGDEFPEQLKVYVEADFRMKRELPLIYFLANCNTGPVDNPYGNGGLRYDDIYMAPGVVLTAPIDRPESG